MAYTPEEMQYMGDLRLRIARNREQDRPAHYGISKEDLARGLDLIRRERSKATAPAAKSKAKKELSDADKAVMEKLGLPLPE